MKTHYSIRDFKRDFPTDEACLDLIFKTLHSEKCSCGGVYSPVKGRKKYQCSKCRFQIAPTAGTIFHKSDTPLALWFHAIFVFSNAKSGISAKEMERQLGVTYKTAWRILTFIRKSLPQGTNKLKGDVEADGAYFGGVKKAGKDNKNLSKAIEAKSVVLAAIERGGELKTEVAPNMGSLTIESFITRNVEQKNTRLITDGSRNFERMAKGYKRLMVDHHLRQYVWGNIHVNNVESFWSHAKRSIKGTHKAISKKYLQSYLDGFVFHYNNRHSDTLRFASLMGTLLHASR